MLKQKACWKKKSKYGLQHDSSGVLDVREILFLKTVKKIARIAWLLNPFGEGKQWKRLKWAYMYLVSLSAVTYPHVPYWKSKRGSVIHYGWALWASLPRCWHRELSLCSAEDHSISESSALRQLGERERAWRVQDTGRLKILQPRQPHSRLIDGNCTAVLLWFS